MPDEKRPAAKKSLGQHFLKDAQAIRRIVETVPTGARVMEIGPGPGALTEPLLKHVSCFVVIEKDRRFAEAWQQRATELPNLLVEHGDVLTGLDRLVEKFRPEWIVGNLPYNISGPLMAKLAATPLKGGMVLMFQREVAERILAKPFGRTYGRLSVLARHHYDVKRLLTLPPGAFSPPPKVHSVVVVLRAHGRRPPCTFEALQEAVRQGFAHRRKTIANNFRGVLSGTDWMEMVIDPDSRPERLDYMAWTRIAKRLRPGV
ncbi:MAG: 16S rRNA (adenine(1518)-N(6)/adenine(1519)-N(6))-dimethyltransferase RsmA [Mariprofundaceae bacterium]|nr:16S rRNA (adenine(1518)-N(6)/adenine(1519)-N(6))-dimethyltransferase RsmA [Mariprofundaceae bacterium]